MKEGVVSCCSSPGPFMIHTGNGDYESFGDSLIMNEPERALERWGHKMKHHYFFEQLFFMHGICDACLLVGMPFAELAQPIDMPFIERKRSTHHLRLPPSR